MNSYYRLNQIEESNATLLMQAYEEAHACQLRLVIEKEKEIVIAYFETLKNGGSVWERALKPAGFGHTEEEAREQVLEEVEHLLFGEYAEKAGLKIDYDEV